MGQEKKVGIYTMGTLESSVLCQFAQYLLQILVLLPPRSGRLGSCSVASETEIGVTNLDWVSETGTIIAIDCLSIQKWYKRLQTLHLPTTLKTLRVGCLGI